jgi:ATP adenylyltransferase
MAEFSKNIWAPWRMEYIGSIEEKNAGGCFLCRYWTEPDHDAANLVLWRAQDCMVLFNRFPYTSGHLLIAPSLHVGNFEDLPCDLLNRMMQLTQDAVTLLRALIRPQGFNIGVNLGKCAGAGLPGHIHIHVVPRWEGDTNFVPVLAETRVMPQALESLFQAAKEASSRLRLPKACPSD